MKSSYLELHIFEASLGGSFGCAVRPETRRSRVQPLPKSATFLEIDREIFSTVILFLPLIQVASTDSSRAVVSFWPKNVHNTG